MEDAIRAIREIGVDVFSAITLRKGISQHFLDDDLYSARERMRALEGRLSPQIDDEPLPTFGYGQAEALFSTDGNTPNSVFPVFWWPHSVDGKRRRTILTRQQSYVRKNTH